MSPYQRWRDRLNDRSRRGVIIVLMALLMIVAMSMAALAIDVGLIVLTQAELTNAVDAAVLAASLELKSENLTAQESKDNAIAEGILVAGLNEAGGRSVLMREADFDFGQRTVVGGEFETDWESEGPLAGDGFVNAVRGTVSFNEGNAGDRRELDLYFGRVIGVDSAVVVGESSAAISPRDLIFLLDVSGSMQEDTPVGDWWNDLFPNHQAAGVNGWWSSSASAMEDGSGELRYDLIMDRTRAANCWGNTDALALEFFQQEFPGTPANSPASDPYGDTELENTTIYPNRFWEHWKWKAYCHWTLYNRSDSDYTNRITDQNTIRDWGGRSFHLRWRYTYFLTYCELVPAIRGQEFYPRDINSDRDLLDAAEITPPGVEGEQPGTNSAYPDTHDYYTKWYYPAPLAPTNFNHLNLYAGNSTEGEFLGDYPGNVSIFPMAAVRRGALFGIHSMLTDDSNAGRVDYDKIGVVSYATGAYPELELTSDLQEAFTVTASRLTFGNGYLSVNPVGNGATNAGMAIQEGRAMMNRDGSRGARVFTIQTMALLTDGVFNISTDNANSASYTNGNPYATAQADLCAEDGIIIHTIGVGNGAQMGTLNYISDETGGQTFGPFLNMSSQASQDALAEVFVNIGADKIGQLIAD